MDSFNNVVMSTYGRYPLCLERGEGVYVWDNEGKKYLDFVAGIATCTLGHAHPSFVSAVSEQAAKLAHVSNLYYTKEQEKLAALLVENSCADKVFFCNSGAEANEGAIKLIRKYAYLTKNLSTPVILVAQKSFHGRTLAALTATAQAKYHEGFAPLVEGFHYVEFNDPAALQAAADNVGDNLAGIILEPLQGEGGIRPGLAEYFKTAREICDEKKALLVFDEVQVGVGRSGNFWAYEHLGVEPDVISSAKGLGGGFPIGALLAKEFCSIFKPGDHASTYGGNPLATHVAHAVCSEVLKDDFLENVRERGEQIRRLLGEIVASYPEHFSEVRGWGLINGLVLKDGIEIAPADIVKAAMANGLLLVPAGASVVRFVPPLIVSESQIEEGFGLLKKTLESLL